MQILPIIPRSGEQRGREGLEKGPEKTAMWELGRTQGTELPRAVGERLKTESRDTVMGIRAILSRVCGHRLAKLVYQGSYPRLPHQALVTRESARLFQRLCARNADWNATIAAGQFVAFGFNA